MAERKLQNLKVQRAVLIDQQERTKEFILQEAEGACLDSLELRLFHVEKQMSKFLEIQAEVEKLDDDELVKNSRASYEETYFTQQPKLTTLIRKIKLEQTPSKVDNNAPISQNNIRLPKITLPTFNGNVTQWTEYYETFKVLIHEESSLNNLQRYQYLKSTLVGQAAAQIASLELNAENYEVALNLLKNKYGDKKIICQAHLNDLLSINAMSNNKPDLIRQFVDKTNVQLRALEALGRPVKQWDDVLVHLTLQRLDGSLRSAWEDKAPESRLATIQELLSFLNKQSGKIETTRKAKSDSCPHVDLNKGRLVKTSLIVSKNCCVFCKRDGHLIYKCKVFLKLTARERQNKIRDLRLCSNCLRDHSKANCNSSHTCRICNQTHHTLLHNTNGKDEVNAHEPQPQLSSNTITSNSMSLHSTQHDKIKKSSYILLPTVMVNIKDACGNLIPCRAILDSASQLSFVSERLVQRLGIKRRKTSITINGIGDYSTLKSHHQTHLHIFSRFNDFTAELDAVILPNISAPHPSNYINVSSWSIPSNIQMSDPDFNRPGRIDVLIGAELHYQLLQVGQITLGENLPVLQKTMLGWIIAGRAFSDLPHQYSCNLASIASEEQESLHEIMKRFWELEAHTNVPTTSCRTKEERLCEEHYMCNYTRNSQGRFTVKIPFRYPTNYLGETTEMAVKRFLNLERRLIKNEELFQQYKSFIHEYYQLNHMHSLNDTEVSSVKYVMPHHCVLKPESSSTKLRVVFDASAKSTTNYSLNDIMMTGPVVQRDLFTILVRFRKHPIAITADICKMYRQVLVDPEDCVFQNIVWRDDPSHELNFFQLKTVTYGTSAAPFLATRSLLQLAIDEESKFPLGSQVIKSDFYVDDLITGADTIDEAKETKRQVEEALITGGFELKKWCSNNKELLNSIPADSREKSIQFNDSDAIKTLGLIWQPREDNFIFKINLSKESIKRITKRVVLSDI